MAAYLRYCLFEPHLFVIKKAVVSSLPRNFLTCARVCKGHEGYDAVDQGVSRNTKESSLPKQERVNSDMDVDLINEIYSKEKNEIGRNFPKSSFHKVDKESYFKQAWHVKMNDMTEKMLATNIDDGSSLTKQQGQGQEQSADTFGTLQNHNMIRKDPNDRMAEKFPNDKDEERDWRKNIPLTRYGRLGRNAYHYTKKITKLGREGKINEAMAVLDDWMMVQDRVMPSKRTFVTLIGIVGRAGYTRKAFQLFRQMKQLGLDAPDQVYTSLFNACANCPMLDYGLKHANALYQQMQVKGIPPEPITVMAAMKAFALCGDFPKAFQILDETRVALDVQCFNTLLMACAMDKEVGFRRALLTWQKMREYNIQPAYQTYNLLVRCIRDCGVGDGKTLAADLGLGQGHLDVPVVDFFGPLERPDDSLLLTSGDIEGTCVDYSSKTQSLDTSKSILNLENGFASKKSRLNEALISENVTIESVNVRSCRGENESSELSKESGEEWGKEEEKVCVFNEDDGRTTEVIRSAVSPGTSIPVPASPRPGLVHLSDLETKPGRLALVGGAAILLSHMKHYGIEPDIKTFSELLSCVPNDADTDAVMLRTMEATMVTPDIDFLNDVMMRRNMRHESQSVKEILPLVSKLRLTPNMRTYAALALSCHRSNEADNLLEDMKAANVEPTIEVMGHLIYISRLNFLYKRRLLEKMEELALKPNRRILGMMEKSIAIAKRRIVTAEKNGPDTSSFYLRPKFQKQFKDFLKFYQSWLVRTNLDEEKHPWERFNDSNKKPVVRQEQSVEKNLIQ